MLSILYGDTKSCVRVNGKLSEPFPISSGVHQGCVLAPTIFNTAIDYVMGRTVGRSMCGVSLGKLSFSDFDFADDVVLLAELFDLLTSALSIMDEETHALGLQISWTKTKAQSLGTTSDTPLAPPEVDDEEVEAVDKFNYLGSLQSSSGTSEEEIIRRIGIASRALGDLDCVWRDRTITRTTKMRLYNSLVLPILLYASETWTLTKEQSRKLDAFDTKSLRRIEGLRWNDFVRNEELRRRTNQNPVTDHISQRRLQLYGHLIRQQPTLEPVEILRQGQPAGWKRPVGDGGPQRRHGMPHSRYVGR